SCVRLGPSATPAFYAARRTVPSASGALGHLRDGFLVAGHLLGDAFVGYRLGYAQVRDREAGVDRDAPELLVLLRCVQLLVAAVQLDIAVELTVCCEQGDVEALDAALLLQTAVEAHGLVEDLEAVLLTSGDRRSPTDVQHAIGHKGSFRWRPGPWSRAYPANPPTGGAAMQPGIQLQIW